MDAIRNYIFTLVEELWAGPQTMFTEKPGIKQMSELIEAVQREFVSKSRNEKWREAQWRLILQTLKRQRVIIAVFGRTLPASFLALSSAEDLARKATELENMTPGGFARFMTGRREKHQDPEVSSSKKAHAQGPSTITPKSQEATSGDALSKAKKSKRVVA